MEQLVFPEVATIRLAVQHEGGPERLRLSGIVFGVRLFARRKNDYNLGPFVSDEAGAVQITDEACRLHVQSEHDAGLMDYAGVGQCRADVEIRHWSGEEILRAAESRRTVWRNLLSGEERLFGSMAELLALYDRAPNARLGPAQPIRPRWNGSESRPEYLYVVSYIGAT